MTLKLDFSKVGRTGKELEQAFEQHISDALDAFVRRYPVCYDETFASTFAVRPVDSKFASIVYEARAKDVPVYLIIDEYDNFTNQMIRATGVKDYRDITHGAEERTGGSRLSPVGGGYPQIVQPDPGRKSHAKFAKCAKFGFIVTLRTSRTSRETQK